MRGHEKVGCSFFNKDDFLVVFTNDRKGPAHLKILLHYTEASKGPTGVNAPVVIRLIILKKCPASVAKLYKEHYMMLREQVNYVKCKHGIKRQTNGYSVISSLLS